MSNNLFEREADMQLWLKNKLKECWGLSELIANIEQLEEFSPSNEEEQKIYTSFNNCLEALHLNTIFSSDENISLSENEILRPDFVLYAPESQGVVIVELKNSANAARQAGTEISAYSGELKNHILFLSDGDIFNVIISPEWRTLLKRSVLHEIFWKHRNVLCLKPIKQEDGEIKLEILSIKELLNTPLKYNIPEEYLCGYQICLYDDELYKKSDEYEANFDANINQMKAALSLMATEGEHKASHGFAFLWKDNELVPNGYSLCPYNITLMNIAPFQSVERFLQSDSNLSNMQRRWLELVSKEDPTGHGYTFNSITGMGEKFLSSFCSPITEGYFDWNNHKIIMFENNRANLVAFVGWGIFNSVFNEKLLIEYSKGNLNTPIDCPKLGLETIDTIIDKRYEYIDPSWVNLDENEVSESR
ncbi:hypothetical protein NYR77_04400 [Actinobacillus equuli subsp. haemolyticus]|uniref:hypothetical protein n=1 Tax=Actinobacillus equuli TaxID=718 RepID=UPI0024429F0D|nr:hypothetical protein [Actinobacillus equuli]WGE68272.1 hypothetical protein NYR77_04400 [Actinobacillus equuli subsp. haemolyticus]